ncbi:PREDICTED: ribonuclease H2 subunit A-like isoform X2 [Priapulus caudatus]|uniref:Ribonuclease n=1 Tax=Priapulus caudatus TaxID=37621 RepID=A0ABM1E5U0_PRICU|nr:PREDICTED: ribonuclease H2 subunit A-like isoform X2 [Priapulus caudatus]
MDISEYEKDNTKNCLLKSSVPCLTKNEPCWLGIDEAGRGPVLGPMVYGICYSPISRKEEFTKNSFADSKTLTEEQREQLMEKINECSEWIGWMTDILSPAFISNAMLRRSKYNLNWISHDSAIGLVKAALQDGVQVEEVYVDTVGDPSKYQQKLQENLPGLKITVAKKADSLYPIVSAASICAKVCRDKAVKGWKFPETLDVDDIDNVSIGSGYPGGRMMRTLRIRSPHHLCYPTFNAQQTYPLSTISLTSTSGRDTCLH